MDKTLADELRRRFIDGATPSELMHLIATHHKDDRCLHFIIGDYFREAFGIPLLRNVVPDKDYAPDLHHAHFNRDVVPEMVQRIGAWNDVNLDGSWLNGLSVHSVREHVVRLKDIRIEELERVWGDLNEKEKLFILRKIAFINYDWEVIKALSLLTERLQQKIVELGGQLRKASQGLESCNPAE